MGWYVARSTIAVDDGDSPYERQLEMTWMGAEHATGLVLCSRGFDARVGGSKVLAWVEAGRKAVAVTVVSSCALLIESNLVVCLPGWGAVMRAWWLVAACSIRSRLRRPSMGLENGK